MQELAALTGGMSGAQIAGMCNVASYMASREGREEVTMEDLKKAAEQSKYGRSYDTHRWGWVGDRLSAFMLHAVTQHIEILH